MTQTYDIFAIAPPGLEPLLAAEAVEKGFDDARTTQGGVTFQGTWETIWRANLHLRGATRILIRAGDFMAFHLAQLDKRATKFPWGDILRTDVPVRVETTTNKRSKIYHAGAATQRIETALTKNGYTIDAEAPLTLKIRIDDNRVTISIDTSGDSLHKRGHKQAVSKAPMRETLAALFLRRAGYTGQEPVLDPMCGSGTFVIEAAEWAMGLPPGRNRSFAFEHLASFDAVAWDSLKSQAPQPTDHYFYGSDRDQGAIQMATANADRAGVAAKTTFTNAPITDLKRPDGPPGLVMVNPPYGTRISNKKPLFGLYAELGQRLATNFKGWRIGIVTSEPSLAQATKLPFHPKGPPVPHGGLKVWLFHTPPLK